MIHNWQLFIICSIALRNLAAVFPEDSHPEIEILCVFCEFKFSPIFYIYSFRAVCIAVCRLITDMATPDCIMLVHHYGDVIMTAMASQITSLTIVYSTVYSRANQRKHQCSASLAFVGGIHRWPVNSPQKEPVTRKMFPFGDVIMMLQVQWMRAQGYAGWMVWSLDLDDHTGDFCHQGPYPLINTMKKALSGENPNPPTPVPTLPTTPTTPGPPTTPVPPTTHNPQPTEGPATTTTRKPTTTTRKPTTGPGGLDLGESPGVYLINRNQLNLWHA